MWRLFRAALCILDDEEPGLAMLLYQQKAVLHMDALWRHSEQGNKAC